MLELPGMQRKLAERKASASSLATMRRLGSAGCQNIQRVGLSGRYYYWDGGMVSFLHIWTVLLEENL